MWFNGIFLFQLPAGIASLQKIPETSKHFIFSISEGILTGGRALGGASFNVHFAGGSRRSRAALPVCAGERRDSRSPGAHTSVCIALTQGRENFCTCRGDPAGRPSGRSTASYHCTGERTLQRANMPAKAGASRGRCSPKGLLVERSGVLRITETAGIPPLRCDGLFRKCYRLLRTRR